MLKHKSRGCSTAKMIFLLYGFGFVVFGLVNGQVQSPLVEETSGRRVIDGIEAQYGQFPYVVQLFYGSQPRCTASIIHERWALTAAHCIVYNKPFPRILVGAIDSTRDPNGVFYDAERILQHEVYTYVPPGQNNGIVYVVNDIGLVRVNQPIAFSAYVQKIAIPEYVGNYANTIGTIVGYGESTKGQKNSRLRYGNIQLITDDECRRYYSYVEDKHICAMVVGTQSVCDGDSGGPLVVNGVQIGVSSTASIPCLPGGVPNTFTKVSSFKPWIQRKLSSYGETL